MIIRNTIKLIISEFVAGVIYIILYFSVFPLLEAFKDAQTYDYVIYLISMAEIVLNIFAVAMFLIPIAWYFLMAHKKEYEYEVIRY